MTASTYPQIDDYRQMYEKLGKIYFGFTCFMILLGFVYEIFGHGVWSHFMVYAFCIPLFGGFVPSRIMATREVVRPVNAATRWLWHAGIATLTVGCTMFGVMAIYGSSTPLVWVYPVVGGVLVVLALIFSFKKGNVALSASDAQMPFEEQQQSYAQVQQTPPFQPSQTIKRGGRHSKGLDD